jgi:hypothetical protein
MNSDKSTLLLLCRAGMEFIWRYAWVFFLSLSIRGRPIPLLEPTVIFMAAYLVTVHTDNRSWRIVQWLSVHIAGFFALWLWAVHRFFYSPAPGLDRHWIMDWLAHLHELHFFFIQFLFVVCLLAFWMGARTVAQRETGYLSVCLQFDKGLGLLLLLLLVKFVAQEKAGLLLEEQMTRHLVFAYFAFGLVAIGLSREQNGVEKKFRPGYHAIGVILCFLAFVLIAGALLTSILLPSITLIADSAQRALRGAAEPMVPVFVQAIRYLFAMGRHRRDLGTRLSDGSAYQPSSGDEMTWHTGFGSVIIGMLGLIALGVIGYLVYLLVRWLLKRRISDAPHVPATGMIQGLMSIVVAMVLYAWHGCLSLGKKKDTAAAVYADMLRWGRHSGLRVRLTETPREYGRRLSRQVPPLKTEIETIVEAFNDETYGNIEIDGRLLSQALAALRKLKHARYWRLRARAWFIDHP